MSKKNNRLPLLLKTFFAPTVFSLFLAILCMYVLFYMPANSAEELTNETAGLELSEEEQAALPVIAVDYHNLVINHKQKPDLGLSLYRNLESQAALIDFYTQITKSKTVTLAIVENADKNDIPLSLAFAWPILKATIKQALSIKTKTHR